MQGEDSLIGRTIHSNIFVTNLIGEGGMGRVYLAHNVELTTLKYAVKVLRPELTRDQNFTQRFNEEARHQADLNHPNIVHMSDYFHVDDQYFLILEFVEGRALSDLIDAKKPQSLPEKQALSYIKDVLAGLNHAHQKAIVHRDVKPSNVLVDDDGRARITDFGIAKRLDGLTRTSQGQIIGTPEYMSPEQLKGSGDIDHRSDVYSAGLMLFEMLTGKLPFSGSSFEAVRAQQASGGAPDPRAINPRIPRRLSEIVQRALNKNPAGRYQGCNEFRQAITAYENRGIWKYYMLAACILIAGGIYTGASILWSIPLVNDAVLGASHDYNSFCREQQKLVHNEKVLELAKRAGLSRQIELLNTQIDKSRTNMEANLIDYGETLAHMAKINKWAIEHVLKQPDPEQNTARVRPVLHADYDRFIANHTLPSHDSMLSQCTALGWETQ